MACRLPGADNLEEYWQLLIEGRHNLGELPPERFDPSLCYHPDKGHKTKSYTKLGGMTSERPFDPQTSPLPQSLINQSHKVHLRLYEVAVAACRHAGLDPFQLSNENVGVYIGHTPPSALSGAVIYARQLEHAAQYLREIADFNHLSPDQAEDVIREIIAQFRGAFHPDHPQIRMCSNAFHAAALITQGFNLNGPSMSFDAACASSLRALGHAARALQLGQIDMAIVGGASYVHSDCLVLFSQAQSVSPTGSRPFDADADGLVASDGYIVLCLKTLEAALEAGDNIQAVIRGIGISSDGKGKSLWAPRQEGQIEAIKRAYHDELDINDLQYVEMHATSTQVGDATEMAALTKVLGEQFRPGKKIPVGSVKANVGHTLESAGLASLVKAVLAMQNGMIPPQINIRQQNPAIKWDQVPFYVPQKAEPWATPANGQPRRTAVNAFGIGGLNVHVVLEEGRLDTARQLLNKPANKPGEPRVLTQREREPVAIIGVGAVFPGARTAEALWDVLSSGQDQKRPVPSDRWDTSIGYEPGVNELWKVPNDIGGFITDFEYDWKKHKVPPKQIATADPLQFMLLDAADQALQDAGYSKENPFDRMKTGAIVGTIFCGEFAEQLQMGLGLPHFRKHLADILTQRGIPADSIERICEEYEKLLLKRMPALVDETGSFTASTLASRITKTFDLMGGATAVDSGDASSFAALNACMDLLQAGDCDMMICAAGHRAMGFATYELMARNGNLSPHTPRGPFDANADGCVPGEGVGVLLLKRLSDAEREGNRIHGIIRGIGVARQESLADGLKLAADRSFAQAKLSRSQISIVETASSGVPQKDEQELAALVKTYGSEPRDVQLQVGAVAGQFGHTGGVSGALELLKAMSELNHAEMVPNVVGDSLRPEVATAKTWQLSKTASKLPGLNEDGRLYAGINSFSQCQVAYHLIIEGAVKVPKEPPRKAHTTPAKTPHIAASVPSATSKSNWRIVRIGAANAADLEHAATEALDQATELYADADQTAFQAVQKSRLAIVAESGDDLVAKLSLFLKQGKQPAAKSLLEGKGIFWGDTLAKPRIGFAFPGQGSQYTGMLKSLVEEFGPAHETCQQLDAVLAKLNLPSFAELAWQDENPLDSDVWRTQLSLMVANTLMYSVVRKLGLKPECVFGHSFGELVALVAAGAWSFEDAVLATRARCESIDNCTANPGALVSTSAPADVIEALCQRIPGVAISHRNAPEQTVAGGEEEAVSRLADAVLKQGYQAKILDVPAAFHTELMEPVKQPFGAALEQIPLTPPQVPLLSSVTNRYVSDPQEIRQNLVVQMTQPVEYVGLTQRLQADGFNVLVEVGPRQVLTGLHQRIFPDGELVTVGCDHPKRSGLQQLLAAKACVEVTGALDAESQPAILRLSSDGDAQSKSAAQPSPVVEKEHLEEHEGLHVLRLAGSPYEIGFQHGQAQKESIRAVLRRYADLAGSRWDRLRDMEVLVAHADAYFGSEDLEEMRGIAKGADVTLGSIISHNLRLYLDAGAGGLHFAITAQLNREDGLLHAANEELQLGLGVRDCLERVIEVRKPQTGLASVTFGVAGQVGSLNGINAKGLAISTSALLDIPKTDQTAIGKLPIIVVKNVLEQAEDIDAAVAMIRQMPKTGAFSLCLSHHLSDRLCYVEFDGKELKVLPTAPAVISANHRLMRTFASEIPAASQHRLNRLRDLLGGDLPRKVTSEQAQSVLRDRFDPKRGCEAASPNVNTLRRVDNQISIIFQPGRGNLWVTAGPRSNGHQNEFLELKLKELLPELESLSPPPTEKSESPNDSSFQSVISADELLNSYQKAETTPSNPDAVCQRFVMRMVKTKPLSADAKRSLSGGVVIVGDNPVAKAIEHRLQAAGLPVLLLSAAESAESLIGQLEAHWQTTPSPHLILATAYDADANTSTETFAWENRRRNGVMLPYHVCQKWYQLMLADNRFAEGSLLAVTRLGGDLGFSSDVGNVEGGALAGLVKGVAMELALARRVDSFHAKIVDAAPSMSPESIAEAAIREWQSTDQELEVGYLDSQRFVVRPVAVSLPSEVSELPQGGVFLITGGARGVTAEVAKELGRRSGAKLHLIGSSPLPEVPEGYHNYSEQDLKDFKAALMKEALAAGQKPIDAWAKFEKAVEIDRNLKGFADAGLQVTYHSCDIGNRDLLEKLLAEIRQTSGPITGIIHGAGFERAASFEKKKLELVDLTIRAKVDGAINLMALTENDPVKFFAMFGSVSGRFGGVGQTDYCLSNEMLSKLGAWYRQQRPGCGVTTFHWHAWDDVGMAVRPESKHIAKLHNIKFMPAREGCEHLLNEVAAGMPESEIAITELHYCRDKYTNTANLLATSASPATGEPFGPEVFPVVDSLAETEPGNQLVAELNLDPVQDVFLAQHRYKERPMMPVVVTLEALAEAAWLLAGEEAQVVGLKNIEILNGLRFHSDEMQTARLHATQSGEHTIDTTFTCDFYNRKGQLLLKDKPYLKTQVEIANESRTLTAAQPPEPSGWTLCWYPESELVIYHGPVFRCLREFAVEGDEGWGKIVAPPASELAGHRQGGRWVLPAALLDSCFFSCGVVLWWHLRGAVAIPDGIGAIQLGRSAQPGEVCLVHITSRGRDGKLALFDFTVFGEDGSVILQVEGYRNVIVAEAPADAVS